MGEKTAVIYARVSTTRQAQEELPIESQVEQCRVKAATLEARVVRVFVDSGISGRSDARPEFQDAIAFCEIASPTYLITWSTSRFARNRLDAGLYKRRLEHMGTQIVYVSMDIDRSSDGGWMMEGILELFDEFTSRQISSDTRRSMIANAKQGFWNGGRAPYGYRPAPDPVNPKRRRLEPVPEEGEVVREMFRLKLEGLGTLSIAIEMNARAKLNRGRRWTKQSVAYLLRNDALAGRIVFGRRDHVARRKRPRDAWLIVDAHPPIIDPHTWDEVQEAMNRDINPAENGSPKSLFLFSGLVRCAHCGALMQIEHGNSRGRRYSYYNCRSWQKKRECRNHRMPARELDEWLLGVIRDEVFTERNLRQTILDLKENCSQWALGQRRRREAAIQALRAAEDRANKIYEIFEVYGKETPNLADLTRRLRRHNASIKKLEDEIIAIDSERPLSVTITEEDLVEIRDTIMALIESSESPRQLRHFFSSFIRAIHVGDDDVKVEYDPAKLVPRESVHSTSGWLPEADVPGSVRVVMFRLPERMRRRAA
jgi:DNA invertase Pin-like site-specific DNA recombinase